MVSEEEVRRGHFGTASLPGFPTGDRTERERDPQGSSCGKVVFFFILILIKIACE